MRSSEINLHDVETIRVEQNKQGDSTWITLTIQHKGGVESEINFWAERGGYISLVLGEKE